MSQTEKALVQEAVKGVPENLSQALDAEAAKRFTNKTYSDLTNTEQFEVYKSVVKNNWDRGPFGQLQAYGRNFHLDSPHSDPWKRLTIYQQGDIVRLGDKVYESLGSHNVNHHPTKSGGAYWKELNSGYDTEREDWNLKVTGTENRYYWITPDGKLFDEEATKNPQTGEVTPPKSATDHARNLLYAAKKTEYTLMDNPLTTQHEGFDQLDLDVAANVKQVAIPVNEFSVKGSENEGTVFFDPDAMDYRLVAVSEEGSIVSGPYAKGNLQLFNPDEGLAQAKDVILHEGRYFLVQNPAGIDKENLSKIVESFPPSGTVVSYSGQVQQFDSSGTLPALTNLSAGQYVFDSATSQYYVANQKVSYDANDLQAAITNANSVATALSNQSQSISMPVVASAFSAYGSSPYSAGDIVSPDGLVTKVATHVMRGTFDPKKVYNGDTDPNGIDPQTGTTFGAPCRLRRNRWSGKRNLFSIRSKSPRGMEEWAGSWFERNRFQGWYKLWRANTALSSAQNTDAAFSTNWTSLGANPLFKRCWAPNSVTDVSTSVENAATTVYNSGIATQYFQETQFGSTPIAGLDKVANGPGNVTASRGQYIHDTTSDDYFLAKSDVTIDLTDSTIIAGDLESNANLNMVSLTERSDGNAVFVGR